MTTFCERHRYLILFPLVTAFIWFGTLLAMLLTWVISGRPKYVSTQVAIAYISDIGASFLKPLFVITCCITGVGLVISLSIERFLRHSGRLPPEHHLKERILGRLALFGAIVAMIGLAFLSGFDTGRYPTTHLCFLLVFITGVSLSAIFTVIEYWWISKDYPDATQLKIAYVAKATIGLTLVLLAIVFAVAFFVDEYVGGVVEWLIAFGFTLYLLTFVYDLWMAKGVEMNKMGEQEMTQNI